MTGASPATLPGAFWVQALAPRLRWIAGHCLDVGNATATLHSYYCQPRDAG